MTAAVTMAPSADGLRVILTYVDPADVDAPREIRVVRTSTYPRTGQSVVELVHGGVFVSDGTLSTILDSDPRVTASMTYSFVSGEDEDAVVVLSAGPLVDIRTKPPEDIPAGCVPVALMLLTDERAVAWGGLLSVGDSDNGLEAQIHPLMGRALPVSSPAKGHLPAFELVVYTATLEQRRAMLAVLGTGEVVKLTLPATGPDMGREMYLAIGSVSERRPLPDQRRPERIWTLECTQVYRPQIAEEQMVRVREGQRTWADVAVEFPTWWSLANSLVNRAPMTWGMLPVKTDPPKLPGTPT